MGRPGGALFEEAEEFGHRIRVREGRPVCGFRCAALICEGAGIFFGLGMHASSRSLFLSSIIMLSVKSTLRQGSFLT